METPTQSKISTEVTRLLIEWRDGDSNALDRLMPMVHTELRQLARSYLRHERKGHTLEPTELVHEAYLRLVDKTHPKWRDRVHFYAVAAKIMRRILVDHARSVRAEKRGGKVIKVTLAEVADVEEKHAVEILALDEAMTALAEFDPRKAKVIELRFFGGLTIQETAQFLEVSTATVITDARTALAWLNGEMGRRAVAEA
jgi:RNA polymerase sigma factor (TIGR02999 family)